MGFTTDPTGQSITDAPLLFVSTGQVNAIAPFALAGQTTTTLGLGHDLQSVAPITNLAVMDTSPGIFTATQTGTGQGAILNADCSNPSIVTLNGPSQPAPKGCAITLFATGAGAWNRPLKDGEVVAIPDINNPPTPIAPVSLTIGGKSAQILYAGAAPGLVAGILQVNAIVPVVPSGPEPIVLKIGANDNSQQNVTVCIQ